MTSLEPPMKVEDYTQGVGNIVTNLQALETIVRYFLIRANNQDIEFPKPGEQDAPINYLTAYKSLGPLIRLYNEKLTADEQKCAVDPDVVGIRDAFAHGRLVTSTALPFTLWKFGEPINTRVKVEFCETLTSEWLKKTWLKIDAEREKVAQCFRSRKYEGLLRSPHLTQQA
jgi:hypothetical protein